MLDVSTDDTPQDTRCIGILVEQCGQEGPSGKEAEKKAVCYGGVGSAGARNEEGLALYVVVPSYVPIVSGSLSMFTVPPWANCAEVEQFQSTMVQMKADLLCELVSVSRI